MPAKPATVSLGEWQLDLEAAQRKEAKLNNDARAQRIQELHRLSATVHGELLFLQFAGAVAHSINEVGSLAARGAPGAHYAAVQWILQMESPQQMAALALRVVIDSMSQEILWTNLVNRIGARCETEARAGRLKTLNAGLFDKIVKQFKGRALTLSFSTATLHRYGLAKVEWGPEGRLTVGAFLLDRVIEATGLVKHVWHKSLNGPKLLYIQPVTEVVEFLQRIPPDDNRDGPVTADIRVLPPTPWCEANRGDYAIGGLEGGLIRLPRYCATQRDELILDWLPLEATATVMAAANYLQAQRFEVSTPITQLLSNLWNSNRKDLDGIFPCPREPAEIPPRLEEGARECEWKRRNRIAALAYQDHRINNPQRIQIAKNLYRASQFIGHAIYFPVAADYRGRLYANGDFNYQSGSVQRASVHFHASISEPLTPDGFDWVLKAAGAAYIGRRNRFEDRLAWGKDNIQLMQRVAADLEDVRLWRDASDRWRFIAASLAVDSYLKDPTSRIGLPVYLDQSCSGLGHIACLARSREDAERTRIKAGPGNSNDIYELVAAALAHKAEMDFHEPGLTSKGNPNLRKQRRAKFWVKNKIKRNIIKEVVISAPYGIRPWGIRQLITDQLLSMCKSKDPKDLCEFVDGPAIYLTEIIGETMKPLLVQSDAIKAWLRAIALQVGHLNRPLEFTTPSGHIVRDAEMTTTMQEFPTTLNGNKFAYHHISPDKDSVINIRSLQSKIVANFLHGIDAALCAEILLSCKASGMPVMAVHDCFATTPNHAGKLHTMLLDGIRKLHATRWLDVLKAEMEQRYGLEIPPPPLVGDLEVAEIGTYPLLFH
jgi:DNA-directed RNA polymerase